MKQFHTKGRENSGKLCVLPPSPGGEGRAFARRSYSAEDDGIGFGPRRRGEGERFLQSHFRSRRLNLPGTGTRDPSLRKVGASLPRLLPKAGILTAC